MSKNLKPTIYGHIVYQYNNVIKQIFLKDVRTAEYNIYLNGKKVTTQQMSPALREELSKHGFSFVKCDKNHSVFRKVVFGVRINGNKAMDGIKIKELVVQIPGTTHREVEDKTK